MVDADRFEIAGFLLRRWWVVALAGLLLVAVIAAL
jgi:hypothetical protein